MEKKLSSASILEVLLKSHKNLGKREGGMAVQGPKKWFAKCDKHYPSRYGQTTVCPKVPLNSDMVLFSAICGWILKPFDLQIATLGRFDMMYDMP